MGEFKFFKNLHHLFCVNMSPVLVKANPFRKTLWKKPISENAVKKKNHFGNRREKKIRSLECCEKKIHIGKRREKKNLILEKAVKKKVIPVYH